MRRAADAVGNELPRHMDHCRHGFTTKRLESNVDVLTSPERWGTTMGRS